MKALRIYLASLLLTIIMISGNGIVFAIHTCISSSTKTISLFEESCGCKHQKSGTNHSEDEVSSQCCSFQYTYHKLDLPTFSKKLQLADFSTFVKPAQIFVIQHSETFLFLPLRVAIHPVDIPILLQKLLI